MSARAYPLLALILALLSTAGADILASMTIAGESLGDATGQHLRNAFSQPIGVLILMAPFVLVGLVSAAFQRRGQSRSAAIIFAVGVVPLTYFYINGYVAAQHALAAERWTAAALSIGLLPFFVGIPVLLVVGLASTIALGLEERDVD